MKSSETIATKDFIIKLKSNINNRVIPEFVMTEGKKKRLSPPQKANEQKIKDAQIEVLNVVFNYIKKVEDNIA